MNIQFSYDDFLENNLQAHWYCTEFPNVTFNVGDQLWLNDFKSILKIGKLHQLYDDDEFIGWDFVDYLAEVTSVMHGYEESVGYILVVSLKSI